MRIVIADSIVSSPSHLTVEGRLLRDQEWSCASRNPATQVVEILKHAESGVPVADQLRKHEVNKATFFKCRSKYGGASVSDGKRLRELEVENAKLKRMCADLALENAAIKDVLNRRL